MTMNREIAVLIYCCSGLLVAISQILLKKSAKKEYSSFLKSYFNAHVIISYTILFVAIMLNMFAMRAISYKLALVLASLPYLFVLILSKIICKEEISPQKWAGALLVLAGIIVFNLGGLQH